MTARALPLPTQSLAQTLPSPPRNSTVLPGAAAVVGDALAGSSDDNEEAAISLDLDLGTMEVFAETSDQHPDEVHLPLGTVSHELLEDTHEAVKESLEDS